VFSVWSMRSELGGFKLSGFYCTSLWWLFVVEIEMAALIEGGGGKLHKKLIKLLGKQMQWTDIGGALAPSPSHRA